MNTSQKLPYGKLIILFLITATLISYWQVQYNNFIIYDDPSYVTTNRHVQSGLTFDGVVWAFTTLDVGNWHPLTWLSHMMDCQIYRLNPAGHHWTSLLIHVLNILLLFYVIYRFTGDMWKSAMVASLFALHPLNVESVCWVSERKNVLSTFFWLLTMLAYGYYVVQPRWERYMIVPVVFSLGLMSKPMLVTLPFVLLLLDFWPLKRTRFRFSDGVAEKIPGRWMAADEGKTSMLMLLLEKIPFFILIILSSIITLKAAASTTIQTIAEINVVPLLSRVENTVISYVRYIFKMLWPEGLSVFYPHPLAWPLWQVMGTVLLLTGVTALAVRHIRAHPYLAVGWFWYVGTLIPVIGLVQVGMQSMADRYAYVPMVGIFIMVVWGISDLIENRPKWEKILAASAGIVFVLLMVCTHRQVQHWQNSLSLFRHAVSVTSGNYVAYNILGNVLRNEGGIEEAIINYNRAITENPEYWIAYNNLGIALSIQGRYSDAISMCLKALKIKPGEALTHFNLGDALLRAGRIDEATLQFREAVRLRPDVAVFHNSLGVALIRQGMYDESVREFRQAIQLDPDHAGAHNNLAMILYDQGKLQEAVIHFSEALRIQPDYRESQRNLQNVLKKMENLRKTNE